MSESKIDTSTVLKGMYAAEGQYLAAGGSGHASFAELLAPFFAEDIVLYQADALPYGGIWGGHEGMQRFLLAMSQTWEIFDMVDQQFLATGSTAVVLTQVHAQARVTGRELDFPILQTLVVRAGRIAEVRPFYWDTTVIAQACSTG